jgi:hypothetical protein
MTFTEGSPWHWRFEAIDGSVVTDLPMAADAFPVQGDAETWIGEIWPALLEAGVENVYLLEGEREVYGPMNLRPAE